MKNYLDVRDFHIKFDLPYNLPRQPMEDEAFRFRLGFLKEEFKEAELAFAEENLVGKVDALIDLVYVIYGTVLFLGENRSVVWPSFEMVDTMAQSLSMHKLDRPGFLPELINKHFMLILGARIEGFALSHAAAVAGDPNGLELCYQSLGGSALVCYTMASLMSIPWESCWEIVHQANMSKTRATRDGSNSQRGTHWDVVKPKGWKAPDQAIMHSLQIRGWVPPANLAVDIETGKVKLV